MCAATWFFGKGVNTICSLDYLTKLIYIKVVCWRNEENDDKIGRKKTNNYFITFAQRTTKKKMNRRKKKFKVTITNLYE